MLPKNIKLSEVCIIFKHFNSVKGMRNMILLFGSIDITTPQELFVMKIMFTQVKCINLQF